MLGFPLQWLCGACCPSAPTSRWWVAPLGLVSYVTFYSLVLAPYTEAPRCCEKVVHPIQPSFSGAYGCQQAGQADGGYLLLFAQ